MEKNAGTVELKCRRRLRLVSAQIVEVTPAIAQEWLKGNCKNRPLNEAKVAFFVKKCGAANGS